MAILIFAIIFFIVASTYILSFFARYFHAGRHTPLVCFGALLLSGVLGATFEHLAEIKFGHSDQTQLWIAIIGLMIIFLVYSTVLKTSFLNGVVISMVSSLFGGLLIAVVAISIALMDKDEDVIKFAKTEYNQILGVEEEETLPPDEQVLLSLDSESAVELD